MTNLIIARLEQTAGLGVEPLIPVPISIESIALHASKSGAYLSTAQFIVAYAIKNGGATYKTW